MRTTGFPVSKLLMQVLAETLVKVECGSVTNMIFATPGFPGEKNILTQVQAQQDQNSVPIQLQTG